MDIVIDSELRTPATNARSGTLDCLLVDDDPLIRLCIEMMVRTAGHLVTSAGDGAEAVSMLATHRFDVVISDIRMPKLDGWRLFEHVRKTSPKTDVILMTAYATVPDAVNALALGACEYLPKPVDGDDLTSHLQRISERRAGGKQT